jgi:hypothetical protein
VKIKEYGENPAGWIVRGGRPARCLGPVTGRAGGMPSYEHDDGYVVFDLLVCSFNGQTATATSRWYGTACLLAPDGMVPVHHQPSQWWTWRPCFYNISLHSYWQQVGSQIELGWRKGLGEVTRLQLQAEDALQSGGYDERVEALVDIAHWQLDPPMDAATRRAEELLKEMLTSLQRTELASVGQFRVRGGLTRQVYVIEIGNGFKSVSPVTGETQVSYCYHPEAWLPHEDVALATKFALEDPELEEQTLECAKSHLVLRRRRPTPEDRRALDYEKVLIA